MNDTTTNQETLASTDNAVTDTMSAPTGQRPTDVQSTPPSIIDAGVLIEDTCPISYNVSDTRTEFSFGDVEQTLDVFLSDGRTPWTRPQPDAVRSITTTPRMRRARSK
jgi:hypothetical protein